jgi:hypothetical protein
MPNKKTHEETCLRELGRSFPEVDAYLDQYYVSGAGDSHRQILHHTEGVEEVRRVFTEKLGSKELGDQAARAAELHIMADFGINHVPTPNEVRHKLQAFTQSG